MALWFTSPLIASPCTSAEAEALDSFIGDRRDTFSSVISFVARERLMILGCLPKKVV